MVSITYSATQFCLADTVKDLFEFSGSSFTVKYLNYGPTEDSILNQCFYSVTLMDLGLGESKRLEKLVFL